MIILDKTGRPVRCIMCGHLCVYDDGHADGPEVPNVHTPAGYKEVFITQTCEDCFDSLFPDED